jgi:hypothetical protein
MTSQANKSKINRRSFLRWSGTSLIAVVGGTVWRAADQGVFSVSQGAAYEPWTDWRDKSVDGPMGLVQSAILASNPHNSQPWLFRVTPTRIDLFADLKRNLGTIDPLRRELHIGVGCALENLMLAAPAKGYAPRLTLRPDPADLSLMASIELRPGATEAPALYNAIPGRHTNRGAYDPKRPVPPQLLSKLRGLNLEPDVDVLWFTDENRKTIGELMVRGSEALVADDEQSRDSFAWWRESWQQLQTRRDGLTLDAQALPPTLEVAAKILPPFTREQNDAQFVAITRDRLVTTAQAFGLLIARNPRDVTQQLHGGRLWQRMHLFATTQGLAMHPLNQICERADREVTAGLKPEFTTALAALVNRADWFALMPFRLGYAINSARPSPRRGVNEVMKQA